MSFSMVNMLKKKRITIIRKLGESLAAEVFSAIDEKIKKSVFIKRIRPEFASADTKEYILRQQTTLLQLNIKQLSVPEIIIDNDGALLLVYPFIDGVIFSKWMADHKDFDTKTLLEIGIALSDSLSVLHKAAFIHKGIKPGNILIQENPVCIYLIDEIRVSDIRSFSHFITDDQYIRGTLPYLSPEQTGKIRFDVNYCSDLYALGTVLYEYAAGRPPFLSDDPLSIIHSHLAEIPIPVSEVNLNCPKIISDIIAVLLEKSPERRYQSATGLKVDLQKCLVSGKKKVKDFILPEVLSFVLKQKDFSSQITIPSIMVGREKQKSILLDEYQRVCSGKFGIAMISGLSGMGKTRLIQELERPVAGMRGYYTSGKFNQYTKHLPYATLTEAFSRLIRQFLTEDIKRIEYWRKQILYATGKNGKLLVDLIPELEYLIGKQPEVTPLPPIEAQNRFNDICCRFIACFASIKHPLVLFIDDMQWCDNATFDMLDQIVSRGSDFPYLFIIGAYRNNEVDDNHRVIQMEKAIKASYHSLVKLHIDSLEENHVNEMIAFMLNTSLLKTKALTDIIYPVSAGNPLFVNESLLWMHQNRRILLTGDGVWDWETDALINLQLPDSARALFHDKLKQFPKDVIMTLSIASLLGTRFKAIDLALVLSISLSKLYLSLKDVFFQRILLKDKSTLSFFHDQIQAAAANFLDEKEKQKYHKQIARLFIDQLQEKNCKTDVSAFRLFSIVAHLSAGHTEKDSEDELYEAARFNYKAGVAAMDSLALDTCDYYFRQSAKLCTDSLWQTDYDFMFTLYKKLARAALINGDQKRSNEIVEIALKFAKTDMDCAECLYEQTVAFGSIGDVGNCIESGCKALELIDESIPQSEEEMLIKIHQFIEELHGNNRNIWQKIIHVSVLKEKKITLKLNLYSEMMASCYASGQIIMLNLLAFGIVKGALEKGVDDFTGFAMSVLALYFQVQEDYENANSYEDTMLKIVEYFPDRFGSVRAMASAMFFLSHSRNSVPDLRLSCQKTIDSGIKSGELQFAGLTNCSLIWYEFIQGKNLQYLKKQIDELIIFAQKYNLTFSLGMGEALQNALFPLWETGAINFDKSTISDKLDLWKRENHALSLACYFTFNGIVAYYRHSYFEAKHFLDDGKIYLVGVTNTIVFRLWHVFRYLVALKTGDTENRENYLGKVTGWASHGPILKPYLALMQAETIALHKNFKETRNAYLDAIELSHSEQYLFLEAFLNERLGDYCFKKNHIDCTIYLNRARKLYEDCGAQTKVITTAEIAAMNQPDIRLLSSDKLQAKKEQKRDVDYNTVFEKELDYNYLFNAVKAITEELDFNKLLKIIVKSIMSRLGAKTGFLLIAEKEFLVPYVYGIKTEDLRVIFNDEPEFSIKKLSMRIARYVYNSKEILILEDAFISGDFISDKIVQRENLRSVLCFPLIVKKQVLGVLYLENSLVKSVFSDTQVKFIDLLTAQAAIALQNAILLQDITLINQTLEERVEVRTKELNKVNEELKDFAYVISHDLKAPLRGITQLSEWIADDYIELIDEDGQKMLNMLKKRSTQMHNMIEGVLQYSRVGRISELSVQVDLNKLIEEVVAMLAMPKSITLKIKNTLPVIKCEETLIFQVFQNLFDNAVKYMDKEEGKIFVSCIEKDSFWHFCVADNGHGIDTKYQKKVFKMFQTLKPKDDSDSTGIGLALIQKIVNNWGGSIWLESKKGYGCKFFFTIPKNGKNK